jgi:regulator of sigma E protease
MNWYILAVIPVFGVLVFFHELGHFLTAKWAGIRVEEFSLGFPPTIVSVRKRDAGGWEVIWFGQNRDIDTSDTQNPFAGTSGGVTRPDNKSMHTLYSLSLLPIGGFVRMPGENGDVTDENGNYDEGSFAAKSAGKRIIVLCAGVIMNFLLAMVLFAVAYGLGDPSGVVSAPTIGGVLQNSPAMAAGLHTDDTVLSVNGHQVKTFDEMRTQVTNAIKGSSANTVPVTLQVRRANSNKVDTIVVNARTHSDEGALGVQQKIEIVHYPLWQAPFRGIAMTFNTMHTFFTVIGQMITGQVPFQVSGPVGVAKVTGEYAQLTPSYGLFPILSLTALLSINVAIVNILPFPALDGGRILLVLIELVRGGKRLKPERESLINLIGFAALLLLMAVVTVSDVIHWGS